MKKKLTLFSLFLIVITAGAQDIIHTAVPKESLKLTNPSFLKKNEISVNILPSFKLLINSSPADANRFSATYKRYLNESQALRFSIVVDVYQYYENGIKANPVLFLSDDNKLVKYKNIYPGYTKPQLYIGYERLFGNNKIKWFYGADLLAGYSKSCFYRQTIPLVIDKTNGSIVEEGTVKVSQYNVKSFLFGISPFIGAKYSFSNYISISAQVRMDMAYQINKSTCNADIMHCSRYSNFNIGNDTGILNDISLIYKF